MITPGPSRTPLRMILYGTFPEACQALSESPTGEDGSADYITKPHWQSNTGLLPSCYRKRGNRICSDKPRPTLVIRFPVRKVRLGWAEFGSGGLLIRNETRSLGAPVHKYGDVFSGRTEHRSPLRDGAKTPFETALQASSG